MLRLLQLTRRPAKGKVREKTAAIALPAVGAPFCRFGKRGKFGGGAGSVCGVCADLRCAPVV